MTSATAGPCKRYAGSRQTAYGTVRRTDASGGGIQDVERGTPGAVFVTAPVASSTAREGIATRPPVAN
jgi:hypothetical protein